MLLKRIFYFFLLVAASLTNCYLLQPKKTGKGVDQLTSYELVKDWPNLQGYELGNPTGLGIDSDQNVIVFHRAGRQWPLLGAFPDNKISATTIAIIDSKTGKIMKSWGDSLFVMPHGLAVDKENNVWVTDVGLHQVFKFSHEGQLLKTFGEKGVPGNNAEQFDGPTDVAIAKDGSFYVSDGYGNNRIIKFSATGKYLFEWGAKGYKKGEFDIPHALDLDEEGNVYVADRENSRIQVFDSSGQFIREFGANNFGSMCSVTFNRQTKKIIAVDDLSFLKMKHRGSDVLIFDSAGVVQTRFGRSGAYHGPVSWYHDVATDRDENIYIGDILENTIQKFKKVIARSR